jgi:hypothetical protein
MSKELTPKEAYKLLIDKIDNLTEHVDWHILDNANNIISQALTRLENLEKKNTPMKVRLELEDEFCDFILYSAYCPNEQCDGKYLGRLDTRQNIELQPKCCPRCGQALDWSGDNKPLQNMESGE